MRINPETKSNIEMTIRRYRGLYDGILVAVHEELYQETIFELNKFVDPSKIFMVKVDNYYCDAYAMKQVAEKMRETGMSAKTAICVRPMLRDIVGEYAYNSIRRYVEEATKVAEKQRSVVMATADDNLVCRTTLIAAGIDTVKVDLSAKSGDYFPVNTVGAEYTFCDAGIYCWQPSVYLYAMHRIKKAGKAYDTMAKLASSLADLGTPVLTTCRFSRWRPVIEWNWSTPFFT
jgi:hypothetical protein